MATREISKPTLQHHGPILKADLAAADGRLLPKRTAVAKLSILWEDRQLLNKTTVAALIVSAIVAFIIPVRYTSTTRLMPPDSTSGGVSSILAALTKGSSELASLGGELFGMKSNGEVFVGMLHSNTVENAIINKFDLRKEYGVRTWKDAREDLESRTDISADRKSGIITIKVSDHSATRAAEIGREYVGQLNGLVTTLDTSAAHRERVFLEARLNEVRQTLEAAEKDFSAFASKNTALDVKEQGRAMIGAAAELEGQLIAAQTSLEGLREIYTPNNVRVRSLQAKIDEYRRQLQKMNGPAPSPDSTGTLETSGGPGQSDYPTIRELPILGVTWADLYRRTRVQEVVFETLTKQYEMAKVEEARETPSVKVLDAADVPEKKSFPPRLLFICLGALFGLLCGCVWSLGRARWQELDPQDPGKKLGADVMRVIRRKRWVARTASAIDQTAAWGFRKNHANGSGNHDAGDEEA